MKKILVLMLSRGVGGLEKRTATLFNCLVTQNLDCQVVFLINRAQLGLFEEYHRSKKNANCKVIQFGMPWSYCKSISNTAYIIDYALLLIKLIFMTRKGLYDVAYFTKFSSLPLRRLVRARKKIVALVDSYTTGRIVNSDIFVKALKESFLVDCLSKDLQETVLSKKICRFDQVFATPCSFIDYSKTGIQKKEKIITFCGRLAAGKGVELLVDALPEILAQNDVQVQILGNGPLLPDIEKVADKFGVERVLIRFSREPTDFLKKSLIFLSLQEKENYPSQALIEAMACGNAIIATNVGLTSHLVNEEYGILISKSPKSLAKAVQSLLADIEETEAKGLRARNAVISNHTVKNYLLYWQKSFL